MSAVVWGSQVWS